MEWGGVHVGGEEDKRQSRGKEKGRGRMVFGSKEGTRQADRRAIYPLKGPGL